MSHNNRILEFADVRHGLATVVQSTPVHGTPGSGPRQIERSADSVGVDGHCSVLILVDYEVLRSSLWFGEWVSVQLQTRQFQIPVGAIGR